MSEPTDTLAGRLLADPARRPALLTDCERLIEAEVDSKSGLSGLAIKAAYKVVCAVKPGIIRESMDGLLDDFVRQTPGTFVEEKEAVTEAGDARCEDLGRDRDRLPTLLVGGRGVGHAPEAAALAEHDARQVGTGKRPGDVRVAAMVEGGSPRLGLIAGRCPFEPIRADGTDGHALERRLARRSHMERGRRDDAPFQRCRVDVNQCEFLDGLQLEPARTAVGTISLTADCREPSVACDGHAQGGRCGGGRVRDHGSQGQRGPDDGQGDEHDVLVLSLTDWAIVAGAERSRRAPPVMILTARSTGQNRACQSRT